MGRGGGQRVTWCMLFVACGREGWQAGWAAQGRHTFADPLHGAHLAAILHLVDGEVDLGQGLLLLYGADRIVDLGIARVLGARQTGAICVHGGRRGEDRQCKATRGEARRGVGGRERVREGKSAKSCLSSQVWRLWAAARGSAIAHAAGREGSGECLLSASRRQSLGGSHERCRRRRWQVG